MGISLRYIDSYDHYASGDLTEKYQAAAGASITAGQGRRSTACLSLGGSAWVGLTLEAQARWTVGVAMRYAGLSVGTTPGTLLDFAAGGVRQFRVRVTSEGFLSLAVLVSPGVEQIRGVSTQALHTGIWYYVEVSILCHASTGDATFRVDGVPWLTLTGINTQPNAGVTPTQVRLGSVGTDGLATLRMDDLYVCDGQGSGTFTTFLGDCRVDALFPNADGTHTAWTPSAGTAHSPLVDEPTPNDDTDYVSALSGGMRDSYQLQPLPTMPSPEVLAVQACISARKEDVDEIRISPLLVSGATTSVASTAHALTASYLYARDLWTADPAGGAWTEAAVNALQVGVERLV